MGNNALISETLKFHFGCQIFCTDGQDGILAHILFDPQARQLTHLTIKQGRLFGKIVSVPFAKVTQANNDGIWLNCTIAELTASPGSAGPGVSLDVHTDVKSQAGNGTLSLVAVQPTSGNLAFIVTHNLRSGRDTLLQAQYVADIAPGHIDISIDQKLLESLPSYRSDRSLQQEVEHIVFDLTFLRIDFKGIKLRVLDGVLYLEGNASSTLRGELIVDQVSGVKGLLGIENHLIGDDALAADIARALGQDARTRDLPIGVYPQLGMVRLSGSVRTASQKAAASEIASSFSGVRDVLTDNLLVDPSAAMLYVMSAPEGGEVKDITPGKFTRHTR